MVAVSAFGLVDTASREPLPFATASHAARYRIASALGRNLFRTHDAVAFDSLEIILPCHRNIPPPIRLLF